MAKKYIPVPQKFVEKFEAVKTIEREFYDCGQRLDLKRKEVWLEFEQEFDVRGKVLRYNDERKIVEVIDDSRGEDERILRQVRSGAGQPLGSPLHPMMKKVGIFRRFINSFKK